MDFISCASSLFTATLSDLTDPAPVVLPALPNDKKSLMRHLEKNSPEALALARDWDDSVQSLSKVRITLAEYVPTTWSRCKLNMGVPGCNLRIQSRSASVCFTCTIVSIYVRINAHTKLHAETLITYTTTLAFYLYLRSNEKYAQRPETLRAHPIMTRLLTLKQSLATLEELDFAPDDSEDEFDEDEDEDEEDTGLDLDELEIIQKFAGQFGRLELLNDALTYQEEPTFEARQQQKPPKKKRKTSKDSSAPVQPIFDLVEPVFKPTKKGPTAETPTRDSVSDVYGEALSLQHADVADKTARRKSLRFHTTKIESAGARRQGARQALGGDDDIPYRERRKEKEARLLKETKERVKSQGGADLDDAEPEPRQNDKEDADADGYYNLVKKQFKEKKEKKKADYEAKKAALRYAALTHSKGFLTDRPDLGRTLLRRPRMDHAPSLRLFLLTEDSRLIGRKARAIPESGNAKNTKKQKRKLRPKKRFIKVAYQRVVGTTMAKSLVYPKLSRVFAWHSILFTHACCLLLQIYF